MMLLLYLAILIVPVRLEFNIPFRDRFRDEIPSHCKRSAKCITTSNPIFMDTLLPYNTTSLDLIPEDFMPSQPMLMHKLHLLRSLQYIPKCWAVVQPFLCSLFMPKCENDTIELPSYERCRFVSTACRIVLNHTIWPSFIDCENESLFPKNCKRDYFREPKFNTTGECLHPLIPSDNPLALFEGVDGCGIPCSDPMYSQDEKNQIHSIIFWAASICLFCSIFTVVTFLIDWRSANKYPACAIFYINICSIIFCSGWLLQFFTNRDVMVCKKDGTLRINNTSGDNLACLIDFVLIYHSMISVMFWYVILTYNWYIKFKAYGTMQDRINKMSEYFPIIAWFVPVFITFVVSQVGEIDGNHVTGICFVGYNNHKHRIYFVVVPAMVTFLIGAYFTCRALRSLIKIKNSGPRSISDHNSAKIRKVIVRIGSFSFFLLFPIAITGYCHWYDFEHSMKWKEIFRDFMVCEITTKYLEISEISGVSECKMLAKPSASKLQLHLLAPFITCMLMSHWIFTKTTVHSWTRFIKRIIKCEEEPIKLDKHKVIAQAFAQRKMINDNDGRCSISFHNSHQDPVGLNFDLNNDVDGDYYSSSWAAHLPKLVSRRGAIYHETSETSNRRNSTDSQISFFSLQRFVAVGSRRSSVDSQQFLSISEVKVTDSRVNKGKRRKKFTTRSRRRSEHHKKNRKDFDKSIKPRRSSTTSQESQMSIQLALHQFGLISNNTPLPNMERRSAFDKGVSSRRVESLLPFLTPNSLENADGTDENLSSEEKNSEICKDFKIENEKIVNESEDDDSEPEEHTKMIVPVETFERSRSKTSNKSSKSLSRNDKRKYSENQIKYKYEDENVLKQLLKKSKNDNEEKDRTSLEENLTSSVPLYSWNLKSAQLDQLNAREIATQTFPMLEIEEKRRMKGIQVSAKIHKKCKKLPK